jgi:hypothetical protein
MKTLRVAPLVCVPLACLLWLGAPLLLLAAAPVLADMAAPAVAPLRDRLVADAGALPPSRLLFDRASETSRTGGGKTSTNRLTDTWNGKQWQLVSTHGRAPSASERAGHEGTAAAMPVPGYYQLAPIVAAATASSIDAQGRTLLLIPIMPANSVRTDTSDISQHMQGEVRLARTADGLWVDQLRVTAREPFKLNMLLKVVRFEQTSEYALGVDGKPRLIRQKSEANGAIFGFPGGEKAQTSFVYR